MLYEWDGSFREEHLDKSPLWFEWNYGLCHLSPQNKNGLPIVSLLHEKHPLSYFSRPRKLNRILASTQRNDVDAISIL